MNFSPELIWFLIGLALILSEFMVPGVILVFFGAGAWVAAVTSWLGLTPTWTGQLLTFAVSSVIMLTALRRWFRNRLTGYVGDDNDPDSNIDEFTGQSVQVIEDIDPDQGSGTVEFKGARWQARSSSRLAAGQRAIVKGVDGITLVVEPDFKKEED
jgi:membrane protein implicated in regulation of membrane protease activity